MINLQEYMKLEQDAEYREWASRMERVLRKKVEDDVFNLGLFLDDEIGDDDWNVSVDRVIEEMTKTLWDSYGDTIGDIMTEEVVRDEHIC